MLFKKEKEKEKSKLNDLKELIGVLKERILNKAILEDIISKLYAGERSNTILSIGTDGAVILDKATGDKFILRITDKAIMTDYVCWNERHHEMKTITFDGDQIVIDYQEATNYIMASTKKPCETGRVAWTEVYKENELRYKREFESKTGFDLASFLSNTLLRETFINASHKAVVREIATGDYDAFYQPGIRYSGSEYLDVAPYDTVHSDRSCYINGFQTITEEEFKEFFNTLEKVDYSPTLRKK